MRNRLALASVLTFLVGSARAFAGSWTVPGTVNAGGLNNTRFVSDLAVTNPGSAPTQVTISFLPATGTTAQVVTLNAGQTIAYRNLLDRLWGTQGAGATQLSSEAPLLIRARTYNTASSGTYGVALPVFADDRLLDLGDVAHSLWVSQSPDGASGYRTNVAVVFPDEGGGAAEVKIYGADGAVLGSQEYSLDAPGFQQFAVGSFAGAVSVGRAEVLVTRGRAAGYSVVVDNVTGDSSLFSFENLPAGYQDILVNGVARANGRNNTFFRTDARFYNPTSVDATVAVAFHASQNANPAPLTGTFTVPAGKIRDVVDVLNSLLGLPVGSAGAMRFTSDTPVAILCRTSNVDPLGIKPGTFGAQQKPASLLSFLMSADAGAVVTGIRQNATFRTNVGFAAGAEGAAYTLTLKDTLGATVATTTGSLGPLGWTQPNVQDLFPANPIPDDATLQVKVTAGSVDVFDSSIDNASGDPVVTPIMPLPASPPSSATIGPAGGSIRSSDGVVTLRIPAGALSAPVTIGLVQASNDAPGGVGPAYDLSPDGLAFAKPALLSLDYGPNGLGEPEADTLTLAVPSGASWRGLTGGRIDSGARTLTIGLSSTNAPASVRAGSRTASAKAGSSRHAFARGLFFNTTTSGTWATTDGKVAHILLVFRFPPSATGSTQDSFLINELNLNPANIHFLQTQIGTVTSQGPSEYTYTAPHSIPHASIPVKLKVRVDVTRGAGVPFGSYETSTILHVIRRKWAMKVEFRLNLPCGGGNTDYAYSYGDEQEQVFHLEDGPTASTFPLVKEPFLAAFPEEAVAKSCKCTVTKVGPPGTVTFDTLGGSFRAQERPPRFEITGSAVIKNMIPAVTYNCPNPVPPPPTLTFTSDPTTYDLNLNYFLLGFFGLRPSDGNLKLILLEPPILIYTVQWRSIAE